MRISGRPISPADPPYIIAEIGVNHDGSEERALELVAAAADAGADAVKVQVFEAERLMSRAARLAAYQADAGEDDPIEMLRRLELRTSALARIVEFAHGRGLHAIATVFSVELVPAAADLSFDAFKSASPDIINRPLLDAMAGVGRPLLVSTGAASLTEIARAVAWLAPLAADSRLGLLQCVSAYPTPPESAAVGAVAALRDAFDLPTGYSDHTTDTDTGALAVSLGACILEKHLTWSTAAAGPDHAASLNPRAFAQYVRLARTAARRPVCVGAQPGPDPHDALADDPRVGPLEKRVLPIERDVRHVSRQSLTAARDLPAGHRLTRADLTIKRPGSGLPPFLLADVLSRPLARPVAADIPLTQADLA